MTLSLPAPAKLNLFLYITGQRRDGYHLLQTLFQFLDYGDNLQLTLQPEGQIRLLTPLAGVQDVDNLAVRAARLLQQTSGCKFGVDISIDKRLPLGGGLGGGSSNAATVLVGLNRLWKLNLNRSSLAKLGLQLGADVPIFIHGQAAFAEGVGEQLCSVVPEEKWYLVMHPGISIATADIFADPELTRNTPKRSLATLLQTPFSNDCQSIVRKRFPEVEELLSWLLEYAPSRLTGTGACVFAEFANQAAAHQVLMQAPAGLQGFVAQGVNISPLQRLLAEQTKNFAAQR